MKTFRDIVTENSLYDATTKATWITNPSNIANAFLFNFLGYLGMMNRSDAKKIFAHLKSDKQLRLTSIGDENNDISLVVKLAFDAKFFRNTTTPNDITRFLVKLKTGGITHVNDAIVHGWMDDMAPLFYQSLDARLRSLWTQFRDPTDRKTLGWLVDHLKGISNKYEGVAGEFRQIVKTISLNSSKAKPKAIPAPPVQTNAAPAPVVTTPAVAATLPTPAPAVPSPPKVLTVAAVVPQSTVVAPAAGVVVNPFAPRPGAQLSQAELDALEKARLQRVADIAQAAAEQAEREKKAEELRRGMTPTDAELVAYVNNPTPELHARLQKIVMDLGDSRKKRTTEEDQLYYKMWTFLLLYRQDYTGKGWIAHSPFQPTQLDGGSYSGQADLRRFVSEAVSKAINSGKMHPALVEAVGLNIYNAIDKGWATFEGILFEFLPYLKKNWKEVITILSNGNNAYYLNSLTGFYRRTNVPMERIDTAKYIELAEFTAKLPQRSSYATNLLTQLFAPKEYDLQVKNFFAGNLELSYESGTVFKDKAFEEILRVGITDANLVDRGAIVDFMAERLYSGSDGYIIKSIADFAGKVRSINTDANKGKFKPSHDFLFQMVIDAIDKCVLMIKDEDDEIRLFHTLFGGTRNQKTPDVVVMANVVLGMRYTKWVKVEYAQESKEYVKRFGEYLEELDGIGEYYDPADDPLMKDAVQNFFPTTGSIGIRSDYFTNLNDMMELYGCSKEKILDTKLQLLAVASKNMAAVDAARAAAIAAGTTYTASEHLLNDRIPQLSGSLINSAFNALNIKDMTDDQKRTFLKMMMTPEWRQQFQEYRNSFFKGSGSKSARDTYCAQMIMLIGDLVFTDVALVNEFFDEIDDPYTEYKIKNAMAGKQVLSDIVSGGAIKPFAVLDEKRLATILSYNNVSYDQVLADSKISVKKKVREKLGDYLIRIDAASKAAAGKGLGLSPLAVHEVARSKKELAEQNRIILSHHSNGRHGDTYMKVLKEFDVHLPKTDYDAYMATVRGTSDGKQIKPAFHGTGGIAATMIMRYGFTVVASTDSSVVGRMLGDGIYFSEVLDKVLQYVGNDGFGRKHGTKGYIFNMENILGPFDPSKPGDINKPSHNKALRGDKWPNGGNLIVSNEYCVRSSRQQINIVKCYEIEICGRTEAEAHIRRGLNEGTDGVGVVPFKDFLTEDDNVISEGDTREIINEAKFVFFDGDIPVDIDGRQEFFDFEDPELRDHLPEHAILEYSAKGPTITFRGAPEDIREDVRFSRQMSSEQRDLYFRLMRGD